MTVALPVGRRGSETGTPDPAVPFILGGMCLLLR